MESEMVKKYDGYNWKGDFSFSSLCGLSTDEKGCLFSIKNSSEI